MDDMSTHDISLPTRSGLPRMVAIRQTWPVEPPIKDVPATIPKAVASAKIDLSIFHGKRVGIAVGSRGIDRISEVTSSIVQMVQVAGGFPVVFAAMGSHGNGTATGQKDVLQSLGITEESIHAPIATCAECIRYGTTSSGIPVYGNPLAQEYDAIILINRIKMHTDFEDTTESGIFKLLSVGIGNPDGCKIVHSYALRHGYGPTIREIAAVMIDKLPITMGVMLVENWKHQLCNIEVVCPKNFFLRESTLLASIKEHSIRLPTEKLDLLIVDEIGKNISGSGMDTKVIGRLGIIGQKEPSTPRISRIVVLHLTKESHGNACGIGLADFAPRSLLNQIDLNATALNSCSANTPENGRLPCFLPTDQAAIEAALTTIGLDTPDQARILYIQNTNRLEYFLASQALYEAELKSLPFIQLVGADFKLPFSANGQLQWNWSAEI